MTLLFEKEDDNWDMDMENMGDLNVEMQLPIKNFKYTFLPLHSRIDT